MFRNYLVALLAATLMIISLVVAYNFYQIGRQVAENHQTTLAVCAYRHELRLQVTQTQNYLHLHPDGIPTLGVSAAQLERSLHDQEQVLLTLRGLKCS